MRETRTKKNTRENSHSSEKKEGKLRAAGNEVTEYERERMARIEENRAKMEALGLLTLAKSPGIGKRTEGKGKGKGKRVLEEEDDEDYSPIAEGDDDGDVSGSSENFEDDYEYVNGGKPKSSGRRSAKVNQKSLRAQKKVPVKKASKHSDYTDEDKAFMKAIALSIKHKNGASDVASPEFSQSSNPQGVHRQGNHSFLEDTTRKKKRKLSTNQVQMNKDEVVINFCHFDEIGKGCIALRDLQRMAIAHDFMWTDKELNDMIRCFDTDGDGKLSLDDFRNIVVKCNMLKASEAL